MMQLRCFAFALCLLLAAGSTGAQPPQDSGARGMTPEQAASRAKARYGGRVLDVRPMPGGKKGAPGYRVKLLDRGEVRTVTVEPGQGKGNGKDKKHARPRR
mgnify:FL=1